MRFQTLTVRARLLLLTLGLVVPLVLAGFFNLWSFWQASRAQLDESLEQQAQLAAKAFEQQLLAQRETLTTVSLLAAASDNGGNNFTLKDYLDSIVKTRPQWLDLQIVNRDGNLILAQSSKPPNLPTDSVKIIKNEAERENSFVVSAEQSADKKLHFFSLAQPVGNGNFVVARIDVASANDVFENLKLPEENIIAVFDKNNRLLYRNRDLPEQTSLDVIETPLFSALNEKREGTIEIESPYDRIRRVYGLARVNTGNYTVAVGVPSAKLYEPARRQFARQAFFGLLIASLAIAAAFAFARDLVKPLQHLTGAARLFGTGDLTARAEIAGGGTIRELGETFNRMADKIAVREEQSKELNRLKSEFVSSVSHELRTPLTTIKTLTRVLKSDKISADERREYLETISDECDRQIDFVQNLLDLSRIESGAYRISPAPVDVVKLLLETVEAQGRAAISRRLKLKFKPPAEDLPFAFADAAALRQIVSSLVENAMKYTTENGEISIAANQKDDRILIEVADNGCGIAAEDLPKIFEKFYRGRPLAAPGETAATGGDALAENSECSTVNETAGVGLGLYLVHNLVGQNGGEIVAESPVKNGKGAKFTVFLPLFGKL
ncbi:MAG: ATP-binding protein [Acidobacteriota bacterium]|nr:ATP-binding protein [Acidobacteriota bacterium]